MPPSGEGVMSTPGHVPRLYPDLTQFYFSEGLEFGPQENHVDVASPYHTLVRPDYPIYPDLTQLNIRGDEEEITPDYPTDNSNEDVDVGSIAPDYSVVSSVRGVNRLNINRLESKILNDKTIEFNPVSVHPQDKLEFYSWMKWRTQVNRQLVAMILIKHGKRVLMRPFEMERKPLSTQTIRSVIDTAHCSQRNWTTDLPGKPYVMYGIPRVQLAAKMLVV